MPTAAALVEPTPIAPPVAAEVELALSGLTKRFGEAAAFEDVSIAIRRGERVALIGANGSGKTTLFRSALRLIEPTSGSVSLFGEPLVGASRRDLVRLRSQVGFVFQRHNLTPRLCALSNVIHGALGARRGPRYWTHVLAPRAVREAAMRCLDRVGLADFALRRVDSLSGGQSQRVAIARALMQRPRLIMADEPVASLDPAAGEEVMALFVDLVRRDGITLFFISHHLEHALAHADRIVGLRAGRIAVDAPAASLSHRELREFFN